MAINGISNGLPDFAASQLRFSGNSAVKGGGQKSTSFLIDDELTPQDKALVSNAAGSVDLPNGQINMLAMQIALDRHAGHLQGPVTASYIEGISAAEVRDQTNAIPQSVLDKAFRYIADQTADHATSNSAILYG
jgi:hypothetical protein